MNRTVKLKIVIVVFLIVDLLNILLVLPLLYMNEEGIRDSK